MEIILSIATVLGGIAAVWFFLDKYRRKDKWYEKDKVVDTAWWESSELKKTADAQGVTVRWSNPDKVNGRKTDGYSTIYEEDKKNRIKYRFINKGGQVLIGRTSTNYQ